ncbi:MAG: hypothetical protein K5896_03840 [Prevotella sp.]|nr:hypothetical protein [Prevotella sp.]
MTKKAYMKPTLKVVELRQKHQILAGSVDEYGMNRQLQGFDDPEDEVEWAW